MTSSELSHSASSAPPSHPELDLGYDARIQGDGSGPPLVYVPGMDGTGALFYRQIPSLARRFRVVTYRLRDDAPDMQTLSDDLARVIETASPTHQPAVLVAESFGGALALSFALDRPEYVHAMVVLNSFPYFRPQFRLRLARAGIRLMPWGAMRLVRRLTSFRIHSQHTHRDEVKRFFELTAAATRHGYLNRLAILTQYDIRDRLQHLHVPVLFLAADQDHIIPSVSQARLMAASAPDATMVVLRGHGHSCLLARSLDLDAMLQQWGPTHV